MSDRINIDIPDEDGEYYENLAGQFFTDLERVIELEEPTRAPMETRHETPPSTYRPQGTENPHNIWITKCDVNQFDSGPLAGKSVGLKDSIALAGVEMTCGSKLLEGYVPEVNATVVERLLDAGASITGKCNMESFAFSASSDTSDYGIVTNPEAPDRIASGSSSGSAAAVAADEVDITLGCDQGASIRVPAASCGVVGLDPTSGLVPYTGIFPMDPTIDNVGPIANTVEDVATTLEIIAGRDGLDPRQPDDLPVREYTAGLDEDIADLQIGILQEGFELEASDPRVNETVRTAIDAFSRRGLETTDVSVPLHHDATSIGFLIWAFGGLQTFKQGGQGTLSDGWYDTHLMEQFSELRRERANALPKEAKATLVALEYMNSESGPAIYGKAQNLRHRIREQLDSLFESVDVVALPTMPTLPFEVPESNDDLEHASKTLTLCRNTVTSSLTGNPSLTVPAGSVEGVPVGLMFIADRFEEQTLLQVGRMFERDVVHSCETKQQTT